MGAVGFLTHRVEHLQWRKCENKTGWARASERERKIGPRVFSIIAPNGRIIRLHVQIATALLVKCLQQLAIIVLLPARRAAPHLI